MAKRSGNPNKRKGSTPPVMKMRQRSARERLKRQHHAQRILNRQFYFHIKNNIATGGSCSARSEPD
ncbi:hypothetical protein ACPV5U_08655 [Vibrio mediterranei]